MGESQNHDFARTDPVHELVREACDQHASCFRIAEDGRPDLGMGDDRIEGRDCGVEEFPAQSMAPTFVPSNRFCQLLGCRCGGSNAPRHRRRISFSIRRFTSSQGSSATLPASMASTRRLISAAQAVSASGSAGPSRLANNSAANSARSSRSKRRASARTTRVDLVISEIIRRGMPPDNRAASPLLDCSCTWP